jgi:hypothetical protein
VTSYEELGLVACTVLHAWSTVTVYVTACTVTVNLLYVYDIIISIVLTTIIATIIKFVETKLDIVMILNHTIPSIYSAHSTFPVAGHILNILLYRVCCLISSRSYYLLSFHCYFAVLGSNLYNHMCILESKSKK